MYQDSVIYLALKLGSGPNLILPSLAKAHLTCNLIHFNLPRQSMVSFFIAAIDFSYDVL